MWAPAAAVIAPEHRLNSGSLQRRSGKVRVELIVISAKDDQFAIAPWSAQRIDVGKAQYQHCAAFRAAGEARIALDIASETEHFPSVSSRARDDFAIFPSSHREEGWPSYQ